MTSRQLDRILTDLPHLAAHLRETITPGRTGTERQAPGYHATAPAVISRIDTADHLYQTISEASGEISGYTGTQPPNCPPTIPAGSNPGFVALITRRHCEHIRTHLPQVDETVAGDIEHTITRAYETASATAPTTPDPERINARCAYCNKLALHKHPPKTYGGPETWKCHACHAPHTETKALERRATRERELKDRKKRGRTA